MEKKGGNMSENIGYIIAPMGLSERQMLIYQKLYEKCNFQDMTVQYTIDQLSCDIKIADIPAMTIYKNIQAMIKNGYLEVIQKASKGNAPIYKIIKIAELMGKPKINQEKTKGKPKLSNIEGLNSDMESQEKTKGKPKDNPIKEKEKENNIYSDFVKRIIKIYPGKKIKYVRDKKLPKILKKYGPDEIIRCVTRYADEVKEQKDKHYILNESTFWNGRYIDYLDCNYEESKEEPKKIKITDMF